MNTLEITYRKAFVNPLILKAFDDLNDKIRFQMYVIILYIIFGFICIIYDKLDLLFISVEK